MAGATANYNPDGTLNIEYYRNATLDIIAREAERRGYTADNLPPTYLNAALRECYHSLFDPRDGSAYGGRGKPTNIEYNTDNIKALFDLYIEIVERSGGLVSEYGFSRYTGIEEPILHQYVTASQQQTTKSRKEAIQTKLYNTPIGALGLANNDTDSGMMWNRQNIIAHETVKKALDFADIVKLAQKQTGQETAGAIGTIDE